MGEKEQNQKKSFEVLREGFARARFGGAFSGAVIPGAAAPITLAPVEDNGGLTPEEYYVCMARLLSKAVTPYRKFDFTKDNVLKDAVSIFEGLTLYANHWADVENWKGKVMGPLWDDSNTPNGINALIAFDRIVDPKLARGAETKALRSFSVTIWFEYMKSHPDLANFYDRLGEEIDGEMVRLIVTKITNAGEVSVVWEGEDPYAKQFNAGGEPPAKPTKEEADMKLSAATIALLGIAVGTEPTEELLEGKITEVITGFKTKVTVLETEVATLKPNAELGMQLLTDTRTEAATLYKALKGEKFQQDFIDGVIQKADLKTARALRNEFQFDLDKSVPLKCAKCGEPVSRRSSVPEEPGKQLSGKRPENYKL